MKTVVAIHQPDFIPYLGYFYKMYKSDIFVFLDDAQYSCSNMHNWNRIKLSNGEGRLKIPVDFSFGDPINKVKIRNNLNWKSKHLKTIEMNYCKAKYFKEVYEDICEVYADECDNLSEFNKNIITIIAKKMGILPKKNFKSSDLKIQTLKEERVIDICKKVDADVYYSGNGAKSYQHSEQFTSNGIELRYTDFHSVCYNQLWNDFIPNLSVIDFIMNEGYAWDKIIKEIEKT
jgi:hypothetical protein